MIILRLPATYAVIACCLCLSTASMAQENAAQEQPQGSELREMREAIGRQSARIEELAREVARLAALIGKEHAPGDAAAPGQPAGSPAETRQQEPEVRKAESAPQGQTHTVSKGETLTSISRQYKVTVAELLQANKIVDDRRLQIGQTLAIPTRNAENTETPEPSPTPPGGN